LRNSILFLLILVSGYASAHSWTPTYPSFTTSHVEGVVKTTMTLWNKRPDVEYYAIDVTDTEGNPLTFAPFDKVYRVAYLQKETIDIFIRTQDLARVTYICSRSLFINSEQNAILSRICSKVQQ